MWRPGDAPTVRPNDTVDRFGKKKKPPRVPPRGGSRKPPGLTVDQWAAQQATKYINAQVAAINEQRRIYLDELDKRSKLEAERGLALANALQGMNFGGRIQGIYGQGAADMAGLAGGFSEGMKAQANSQAAEMANMLSGTGQEAGVRNEGVGMADVNYGTQGYIPGRSMVESGAAFGAQAALEPSFAARIGQLEASRVHNEGLDGLDQFTQALVEARSGRPELVQKFSEMRRGMQNDEFERRFEMMKWQADQHYRNYMLALERGDRKLAMKEYNLAVRKQRQAELEANRQYGLDVRKENRYAAEDAAKAKGGGLTKTQQRVAMKEVISATDDIGKALAASIKAGEWFVGIGPAKPGSKQKVFLKLYRAFKHLTMGDRAAQARLKQIIRQAMDAAVKAAPTSDGRGGGSTGTSGGGYEDYK